MRDKEVLPDIIIKENRTTEIYVNGKKVDGVRAYHVSHEAGSLPVLKLDIIAAHMALETKAIPALPEIFKGFYVLKE